VGLFGAKLAGFDLGSKMSAISSLTGVQTGKDLQIEKLTTNLRMVPDGLKADHLIAVVPSLGNLVGGGTIDSKNNLDFKLAATLTSALRAAGSPISSAAGTVGKLTDLAEAARVVLLCLHDSRHGFRSKFVRCRPRGRHAQVSTKLCR
jgi:AsmA protein